MSVVEEIVIVPTHEGLPISHAVCKGAVGRSVSESSLQIVKGVDQTTASRLSIDISFDMRRSLESCVEPRRRRGTKLIVGGSRGYGVVYGCLLYTSDAADE